MKIVASQWPVFMSSFAISVMLLALCSPVSAQQVKIPRIGYLSAGSASSNAGRMDAFRQGMRDLGYVEGRNILVDYRYTEGRFDRLPGLAAEIVRSNPDVILSQSLATRAAQQATKTIPIVFVNVSDPVMSGYVTSLARPGGNTTGLTSTAIDLAGKRLELLKEVIPRATRVAILMNPDSPSSAVQLKEIEAAAPGFDVQLQSYEVHDPKAFDNSFSAMTRGHMAALVVLADPMFGAHQRRIAELAAKNRLPTIYQDRVYVDAGGLLSYGADISDMFRRAAIYVDKILKGTKPADLPVEQPTKFELVINLKTAKQIGLIIPPNVLARADRVIR